MSKGRCPICASQDSSVPVISVSSNEAANHFVRTSGALEPTFLREHIEKLWNSTECQILKCVECGSRFSNPHIAGDAKFYNLAASPIVTYPKSRWEFNLTVKLAAALLKNGGQLLEIGGGSGAFVKLLIEQGLSAQRIVVTEFSPSGLNELRLLGVQAAEVDFRVGAPGGPFRVIVLFQTLEHLDQLDQALDSLKQLGTSDAEIFISVPNVAYIAWAQETLGIIDMPPNHINAFSEEGLRRLFHRHGWMTIDLALHTRESLTARCKHGALRGLSHPSGQSQKALSYLFKKSSTRFGKLPLLLCAVLVLFTNWSLIRLVPPEDIWIHLKRDSHS
jgi:hypothetical protein